ncbi:MAG: TOBE domain-containing protein [Polaromonas sp.]
MAISARNVFKGKVTSVKEGPINAEVEIEMAGGDKIVAIVTDASVKSLGLAVGKDAVAVIKAPWVTLLEGAAEYRFSARNQLRGIVGSVIQGGVNSQVNVALPGGAAVFAVVTNDAVEDMGLQEGMDVVAMFKAGHVIVGVPA